MSNFSSDYDSSFGTESEADNEYFWNEDPSKSNVRLPNYTTEVEGIIRENVDVTTANAIELNHHYRTKLLLLRTQLETLLSQCQARLKDVDGMVDSLRHGRKEGIPYRVRAPGYICGQPFFKDHELYPGPHNADYLYRKNVKKEFFPLDMFEVAETHWTPKDKQHIKNGIWLQALEFLRREDALRLKMCSDSAAAEYIRQDISSYKTLSLEAIWSRVQEYETEFGGQRFQVDWLVISNVNVMSRHTAAACEAMWNQYLKPGLKKSAWQPEEDSLLAAVHMHNGQDWSSIARSVGNRSEYQCFVHYRSYFSHQAQIERKPWTPEEDARLLRVVQENRIGSNIVWNKVVEHMPCRNKIQVYHRYKYTLMRPNKGTKFSAEEDCIITAYVQQYGEDFKFFPEHLLPGRTMKQVWARYNNTLRYVDKRAGWSLEEDKRLMSYIAEHLTEEGPEKISWSDCSRRLCNHSRASCRSRYYTIEKFLDKHPNATLEDVPRRERKKLSTDVTDKNWIKTIIDIRSTPNEDRKSPTDDKLCQSFSTPGEWGLYEQMKFCFRYQFGHRQPLPSNPRHVHTGTKILMHLLEGFHESEHIRQNTYILVSNTYFLAKTDHSAMIAAMRTPLDWSSLTGAMSPKKNADDDGKMFCRLPPSYNTVLGLRGVCLNAYYESTTLCSPAKSGKKAKGMKRPVYDQALALFVDRFKKIFHWSMLLTMLNIDDVKFETEAKQQDEAIPTLGNEHGPLGGAAESNMADATKKGIGHDHLIPIPIDKLMQTSGDSTVTPEMNSLVSFSLNGICGIGLADGTEGDIEIVKSITIIDPKDLPAPSEEGLHWDDNIARTEEVSDFHSSPESHVSRKRTRRQHHGSQRRKMNKNDECHDPAGTFNSHVETTDSLHGQAGTEKQTYDLESRATSAQSIRHSAGNTVTDTYHVSHGLPYAENEANFSQQHQNNILPQILFAHSALAESSYQVEPTNYCTSQEERQAHLRGTGQSNTIINFKCDTSHYEAKAISTTESKHVSQIENHVCSNEVGLKFVEYNYRFNATLENGPGTSAACLGQTATCSSPRGIPSTAVNENVASVSSDTGKDRIRNSGGTSDVYQTSAVLDTHQSIRIAGPILENHCREVFIVREIESETQEQQSRVEKFISPNRSGEHDNECSYIVEDHGTKINDQQRRDADNAENSNENPIEKIFIVSEASETNAQSLLQGDFETVATFEGNEMLSGETFEQPAPGQISTEKGNTTSAGPYEKLLGTIDESYTAVDIIRILNEGRHAENDETSDEHEWEEDHDVA